MIIIYGCITLFFFINFISDNETMQEVEMQQKFWCGSGVFAAVIMLNVQIILLFNERFNENINRSAFFVFGFFFSVL